jgi:SAM-dependent MidA family methyltransferase
LAASAASAAVVQTGSVVPGDGNVILLPNLGADFLDANLVANPLPQSVLTGSSKGLPLLPALDAPNMLVDPVSVHAQEAAAHEKDVSPLPAVKLPEEAVRHDSSAKVQDAADPSKTAVLAAQQVSAVLPQDKSKDMSAEQLFAAAANIFDNSARLRDESAVPALSLAELAPKRQVLQEKEVVSELVLDARARKQVPDAFYSFKDYMESMLHHPGWGYYTSGRVKFGNGGDYSTYPILMSPYFGQMLASHALRMWEGMIRAGTLSAEEPFTVAEFGGGDGTLAHDFLNFVKEQARLGAQTPWGRFAQQLRYVSYERSPALRRRQAEKNAAFGAAFRTEEADARDSLATIPAGSIKGLVFSNELPDAFGTQKVVFSRAGKAEAAHVIAYADKSFLSALEEAGAPPSLRRVVEAVDQELRRRFAFHLPNFIYFDRAAFEEVMGFLSGLPDDKHGRLLERILFHETYVSASLIPSLAEYLRRNATELALGLSAADNGYVAYLNVDADRFIQGAGAILKAGYVLTIDYGHHTLGLVEQSRERHTHFRTYREKKVGFQPYENPSLRDMTTDVDFSALARSGAAAGLRMVHFGPQGDLALPQFKALQDVPDISSRKNALNAFFTGSDSFRLLVQQKPGTDDEYVFSSKPSEAVTLEARARQIQQALLSPEE